MFRTLLRKELHANLLSPRLRVPAVCGVAIAVGATLLGTLDFARNMRVYEREAASVERALEEATVYSQVQHRVVVPPQAPAIFSRGIAGTAAQGILIRVDSVPISSWKLEEGYDSDLLMVLPRIDFAAVVAVIFSLMAVLLGHDGLCGERQSGTLRLLLANPVERREVVRAKLAGGMISLSIPLAAAFALCLLVLLVHPAVRLSGEDGARLGLFLALSCLFLAQVHALSLMVSSLVRRTETALVICLFAWLAAGVGYGHHLLPSLGRYLVKAPPAEEYRYQDGGLWGNLRREVRKWEEENPSPGQAWLEAWSSGGALRYGHPLGYEWRQRKHAFEIEKRLERAELSSRYHWANWERLSTMASIADLGAIALPATNYQLLSSILARTTQYDRFYLTETGREYREALIEYLRGRGGLAGRRWFTDDPEDQVPMIADPASATEAMLAAGSPFMRERLAWVMEQEESLPPGERRLNLTDMPRFEGPPARALGYSLALMIPGLLVLTLGLAVPVWITTRRFGRGDPK